ncbi:uncharacterized protein [Leuresthes tenuis]|uniref:uncharacterized protein n=1 Tax=Leuresthes tenuis TaxID=355514 RepID=UPI003B50C58C
MKVVGSTCALKSKVGGEIGLSDQSLTISKCKIPLLDEQMNVFLQDMNSCYSKLKELVPTLPTNKKATGEEPSALRQQRPPHAADHTERRARQHRSGEWLLRRQDYVPLRARGASPHHPTACTRKERTGRLYVTSGPHQPLEPVNCVGTFQTPIARKKSQTMPLCGHPPAAMVSVTHGSRFIRGPRDERKTCGVQFIDWVSQGDQDEFRATGVACCM